MDRRAGSQLTGNMIAAVLRVVRSINEFSDEQFAALQVQARAWYTIVRSDGCVPRAAIRTPRGARSIVSAHRRSPRRGQTVGRCVCMIVSRDDVFGLHHRHRAHALSAGT